MGASTLSGGSLESCSPQLLPSPPVFREGHLVVPLASERSSTRTGLPALCLRLVNPTPSHRYDAVSYIAKKPDVPHMSALVS